MNSNVYRHAAIVYVPTLVLHFYGDNRLAYRIQNMIRAPNK